MKHLFKGQLLVTTLYLFLNFKEIRYGWSTLLSIGEVDIVNHLTNFNVHVKLIFILLILNLLIFGLGENKAIAISRLLQVIVLLVSVLLLVNAELDLARWIEINVFAGIFLVLLTLMALIRLIWIARITRKTAQL
ncbi:MAG: hypothetical protein KJP00_06830 [Bacteroidia bacterium]|nr:hypothetical protein [Bacteroidia bacterium]